MVHLTNNYIPYTESNVMFTTTNLGELNSLLNTELLFFLLGELFLQLLNHSVYFYVLLELEVLLTLHHVQRGKAARPLHDISHVLRKLLSCQVARVGSACLLDNAH